MQKFPKVFTLMSAILALAFGLASCKSNVDDDPTMYTVTVSSSIEHGKVTADKTSAEAGATIKLTATADSGYELDSYSVKDASENELAVTDDTFTMPESNVTVSATFKATAVTSQKTAGSISYATTTVSKTTDDAAFTNELTKTGDGTVTYASSKETVATVNATTGEVTIKGAGETTITATVADSESYTYATKTASYTLTITAADTTPQKTAGSISYAVTSVEKTTADGAFTNVLTTTGDGTVTYTSSKTDVAEVNTQTGLVTIKGAGETTITATVADSESYTYATKTASYTLTVTQAAGSISYATTTVSKTTADEAFTNTLTNTGDGTVTYASSKETVATVNATTGEVTIKGVGETTITATVADSDTYTYATKTASYTLKITLYIGTKAPSEAKVVGDIVFSDGSATPYSTDLTLSEAQKEAAVAVIYYAGSASDTLGAKTLGVGLKNTGTDSLLAWAKNIGTNITAIQCTPAYEETEPEPADEETEPADEETEPADEETAAATATFTGDFDGSDNWQALCDAVSDEGTSGNYPAWEWVNAYATENSLADSYANGWYLPTVAELSMLYRVKDTVNSALEKAGGTKIADTVYWSSSQVAASYTHTAWTVDFGYGTLYDVSKDVKWSVCTVHAF
mgnify:CR=1 FL=1